MKKRNILIISSVVIVLICCFSFYSIKQNEEKEEKNFTAYLQTISENSGYAIGRDYTNTIVIDLKKSNLKEEDIQAFDGLSSYLLYQGKYYITFTDNSSTENAIKYFKNKDIKSYRNPIAKTYYSNQSNQNMEKLSTSSNKNKITLIDTGVYGLDNINLTKEENEDLNGHGTGLTRFIQDNCNESQIISIKAINHKGYTSELLLCQAMDIAMNKESKIIILTSIFGSDVKTPYLNKKIKEAKEKGITILVLTEDNKEYNSFNSPVNNKNIIHVKSYDELAESIDKVQKVK